MQDDQKPTPVVVTEEPSPAGLDVLSGRDQRSAIPAVAEIGRKNVLVLAGILGAGVMGLMWAFGGDDKPNQADANAVKVEKSKTTKDGNAPRVAQEAQIAPVAVAAPVVEAPPPPPPPPPPAPPAPTPVAAPKPVLPMALPKPGGVESPANNNTNNSGSAPGLTPPPLPGLPSFGGLAAEDDKGLFAQNMTEEQKQRMRTRLNANMVVAGGGGGGGGIGSIFGSGAKDEKKGFQIADSAADKISITDAGDPRYMITQGKIIDTVLESAINTDLPGVIRGVVSRDVYAEAGRSVLIPKGSRVIGSYSADVKQGQARIYIVWNRIIRPDGIDAMIDSPSVDLLGRSGQPGTVDSKYLEIFSSSLLLSTITIAFAAGTDGLTGGGQITQGETGSGDSTTSGDVTSIAVLDAVKDFSGTVSDIAGSAISTKPTITVNQGTRVKIFVNRDIKFPPDLLKSIQFVE